MNLCELDYPLISVIVPIYNVEQYLEKCIDSIISQTYKNIEIILIDDGSSDNSGGICDRYSLKDERIRVVHKKNGGLSSARNTGIKIAKGEFFSFIDSDDWVTENFIELLFGACAENKCKLSICGRYEVYEGGRATKKVCPYEKEVISRAECLSKLLLAKESDFSACDKLYHKSLWEKILFPEGKLYEDIRTLPDIINQCESIAVVPEAMYYYRVHANSITKTFNMQTMELLGESYRIYENCKKEFPEIQEDAFYHYLISTITIIAHIQEQPKQIRRKLNSEYKEMLAVLRKHSVFVIFNKRAELDIKIKMILLLTHTFKLAKNIVKRLKLQK